MSENKKSSEGRRKLLKSVAVGGGAFIAGKSLPEQWSRPMIDVALLPAHAQTSTQPPAPVCGSLTIDMSWAYVGTPVDMDLELDTPGGSYIAPKAANGVLQGATLEHGGDVTTQPGPETISPIGAVVNPGTYTIYIRWVSGAPADYSVTVSGCQTATFTGNISTGVVEVGTITVP